MSWSMSSIVVPASAICRSRWPSSSLSSVSSPAAGSSRHRSRGSIASARATPTSLRCPWVSSRRHRLGDRAEVEQLERVLRGGALADRAFRRARAASARNDGRWAATVRFSRTVRSSNSSVLCQVRASPRCARTCGGSPATSRPSSSTRPVERTNPVIASMNVVLPAPFGPISPTSWPSSTSTSTSSTARTPPKRPRGRSWRARRSCSPSAGSGSGELGLPLRPRLGRPVEGARHALRVLDQREDQDEPPNSRNQFPVRPNHLSSAYGKSAWVAIRPAKTAPETSVMPPA